MAKNIEDPKPKNLNPNSKTRLYGVYSGNEEENGNYSSAQGLRFSFIAYVAVLDGYL